MKLLLKSFIIVSLFCTALYGQDPDSLSDSKQGFKSALENYQNKNYKKAYEEFSSLANKFPNNQNNSIFSFMAAKSLFEAKDYIKANSLFDDFINAYPGSRLLAEARLLKGHSFFRLKDYLQASQEYIQAIDIDPKARAAKIARENLFPLISKAIDLNGLQSLIDKYPTSSEQERLQFVYAERLIKAGRERKGAKVLESYIKNYPDGEYSKRAKSLLAQASEKSGNEILIGLLAPLSGPYREYGRSMYEGAKLAIANLKTDSRKMRLLAKDTNGDPILAAKLAITVADEDPAAVIGPLRSESAIGAAIALNDRNIPMITPTASERGLADLGPNIFQISPSVEQIGKAMAEYAVSELKLDNFAVIAPDDISGQKIAGAFIQEIYRLGKDVISATYYPPGSTDFKQQIMPLREILLTKIDQQLEAGKIDGSKFADPQTGEMLPRDEWPVELGGLFLPGYADDLKLLIPQIRYRQIKASFLGSDGWDSADFIKGIRPYAGNAVFATDFHLNEGDSAWIEFSKAFLDEFKHKPDKVAVMTYDATSMALLGIKEGNTNAAKLREFLSGISDYQGICCPITFKGTGRANKSVAIYSLDGKELWSKDE